MDTTLHSARSVHLPPNGKSQTLPPNVRLRGVRASFALPSGPVVNLHDAEVEADFETRTTRPAGVILHLVLEGRVEATLAGTPVCMAREAAQPVVTYLSALRTPQAFVRKGRAGDKLRKVTVCLSWDWLRDRGFPEHQVMNGATHWQDSWPTPQADILRAEALFDQRKNGTLPEALLTVEKEAIALSMIRHALETILDTQPGLTANEWRMLQRIEGFACASGPLPSLDKIAVQSGVSLSSMQRLFRRAYGCTVLHRLRDLRLERSKTALADGASVTEAADIAGYATATAFATAFRKHTGQSPSAFRVK